jgi:hypothetical protein
LLKNNDNADKFRMITSMIRMERNGRVFNDRAGQEFAEFIRYQCGLQQIPIMVFDEVSCSRGTANHFVTTFGPAGYTYLTNVIKDYIKPLRFGNDMRGWARVDI